MRTHILAVTTAATVAVLGLAATAQAQPASHPPRAQATADGRGTQLNPAVTAPVDGAIEVPTVVAGESDTTWTVTRWIAANGAAFGFLAGHPDPFGMHLNTFYRGLQYPANQFIGQDPFPLVAHEYSPVLPFSQVAIDQAENWPATYDYKDQSGH